MITVKVKTILRLSILFGRHIIEVQLPDDAVINDLLDHLIEEYGPVCEELLKKDQQNAAQHKVLYFLNGNIVSSLDTVLHNEDEVYIMLPAGGG